MSAETKHIIRAMHATGNRPGVIEQWKQAVAGWAQMHRTDPDATAVNAWLPLWQPRPFYTVEELAPMWPALAIATGFTDRWPAVVKSARRLEFELDSVPILFGENYRLPRLPEPWRSYFICERIHFWKRASTKEISREIENAQR